MNIDTNNPDYLSVLLPKETKEEVVSLAGLGLTPAQIAAAIGMTPESAALFIALADMPGSAVARLIETGLVSGLATSQKELQKQANSGDVDAIKELMKVRRINRFNELIYYMDDDEFTG